MTSSRKFYHVNQVILEISYHNFNFISVLPGKQSFYLESFWFKFNNSRLVSVLPLIFLKSIPTFGEVMRQ